MAFLTVKSSENPDILASLPVRRTSEDQHHYTGSAVLTVNRHKSAVVVVVDLTTKRWSTTILLICIPAVD